MKKFKIPVSWEVYSTIEVEAETLDEAIRKFDEKEDSDDPYELPLDSTYIDASFKREDEKFCELINED